MRRRRRARARDQAAALAAAHVALARGLPSPYIDAPTMRPGLTCADYRALRAVGRQR